jgi:O-antigen ligase
MLQNKIKISSIKNNFMLFIAFTLPLNKNLLPLMIVITLLLWLFEGDFNAKIQNIKTPLFFLIISFYVLHLFGLLYTANTKAGSFDLEQKLSLLVFPILIFSTPQISSELYRRILKSFVLGCALAGFICLVNAVYKYYLSGNSDSFFYAQFSVIMHASYFAMYVCFSFIILLFCKDIFQDTPLKWLLLVFFVLLVILSSSKSGAFALLMIIIAKAYYDLIILKKLKQTILLVSILIITVIAISQIFPKTVIRLTQMKETMSSSNSEFNTTSSRIAVWKHGLQLISENFIFGVGTGDVKDALKSTYDKQIESQLVEKQLNAHNQYLQSFIALGLPGFIGLISILGLAFLTTVKNNFIEGAFFIILVSFNMLFESMFETQAGVIFIAFFLSVYGSMAGKIIITKNVNIAP